MNVFFSCSDSQSDEFSHCLSWRVFSQCLWSVFKAWKRGYVIRGIPRAWWDTGGLWAGSVLGHLHPVTFGQCSLSGRIRMECHHHWLVTLQTFLCNTFQTSVINSSEGSSLQMRLFSFQLTVRSICIICLWFTVYSVFIHITA